MQAKHPRDVVKEVWRCQASENIESHEVMCACEDIVISSSNAGIKNMHPLVNFAEFSSL